MQEEQIKRTTTNAYCKLMTEIQRNTNKILRTVRKTDKSQPLFSFEGKSKDT